MWPHFSRFWKPGCCFAVILSVSEEIIIMLIFLFQIFFPCVLYPVRFYKGWKIYAPAHVQSPKTSKLNMVKQLFLPYLYCQFVHLPRKFMTKGFLVYNNHPECIDLAVLSVCWSSHQIFNHTVYNDICQWRVVSHYIA